MTSDADIARIAIFEVIDNQLKVGNPPEVKETLKRLLASGHSEKEARRLLGCVVTVEIFAVLNEGREYDQARYVEALHALPKLPF